VEAIKTICGPGAHVNIVQVLDHGRLSNAPFYFIDMEFFDFNLHDYIQLNLASTRKIWVVMSQVAAGVEYIHKMGHVHKDIKPKNGVSLYCITGLLSSILVEG
jgi:serine/threonine protein kinase